MSLHVYANNVTEWVIAESVQDARDILTRHYADWDVPPEDCDLDFTGVPDDKVLTRVDVSPNIAKTAAEWCMSNGKGFLMTTEY